MCSRACTSSHSLCWHFGPVRPAPFCTLIVKHPSSLQAQKKKYAFFFIPHALENCFKTEYVQLNSIRIIYIETEDMGRKKLIKYTHFAEKLYCKLFQSTGYFLVLFQVAEYSLRCLILSKKVKMHNLNTSCSSFEGIMCIFLWSRGYVARGHFWVPDSHGTQWNKFLF